MAIVCFSSIRIKICPKDQSRQLVKLEIDLFRYQDSNVVHNQGWLNKKKCRINATPLPLGGQPHKSCSHVIWRCFALLYQQFCPISFRARSFFPCDWSRASIRNGMPYTYTVHDCESCLVRQVGGIALQKQKFSSWWLQPNFQLLVVFDEVLQ